MTLPAHEFDRLADRIAARLTAPDASAPQGGARLLTSGAATSTTSGRTTSSSLSQSAGLGRLSPSNGWGCLQTESELALNLQAAQRSSRRRRGGQRAIPRRGLARASGEALLAATTASPSTRVEDASVLASMVSLRRFNLSSRFRRLAASWPTQLPPPTLAAILVDQLTCARASTLLLNAFSTFSQLVMGRIGLRHPLGHERYELGWVRDLTAAAGAAGRERDLLAKGGPGREQLV